MLNASAHTLKLLAALVWYTGVAVLLVKSTVLFLRVHAGGVSALWVGLFVLAGLGLGLVKAKYLFVGICRRNLGRIQALETPMLWQFYRWQFFVFLGGMIVFGVSLSRVAQGHPGLLVSLAVLELSIAVALFFSSWCFWEGGEGEARS